MPTLIAMPANLQSQLNAAKPSDTVLLRGGDYPGTFTLSVPGVTVAPYEFEPAIFRGPLKADSTKPAWLHIQPSATESAVRGLRFERDGDIAKAKAYNDFGIIVEADDVTVDGCRLYGMVKGVHIKGKCLRPTVTYCDIGPTYQSNIVVGTSYGAVRAGLIAWNILHGSRIEDAIQFMQNFDAADPAADVSNLGMIVYRNEIHDCNENAIDLKGAGQIIIDGNTITHTAGSNNGDLNGWNHNSNASIMHGKNTTTGAVLIRNNDLQGNCSGIRMHPFWTIIHNLVADNNYSPADDAWQGYGIVQRIGVQGAAAKNNLVYGHQGGNLTFLPGAVNIECNPDSEGPGAALTTTAGDAVASKLLAVADGRYFTDWFGRKDLPADVIFVGGTRYEVRGAGAGGLVLDQALTASKGAPVYWRSPSPTVGVLAEWEAPPVDPPVPVLDVATVRLILSADMPTAAAVQLRALLAGRAFKVEIVS